MTIPFIDAAMGEVLARVAIRVVEQSWRRRTEASRTAGAPFILEVSASLPGHHFGLLRGFLHSMAVSSDMGVNTKRWSTEVTQRSKLGYAWRQCVMPVYKANRRKHPPVSNTGVLDSDRIYRSEKSPLAKDFTDDQ